MKGFKPSETFGVVGFGAFALALLGVSAAQLYGGLSVVWGDPGSGVLRLLYAVVGLGIAFSVARTAYVRFQFARVRRDMALRPEASFEGHPYEALLLADDDVVRLARKLGELCRRRPTTDMRLSGLLADYGKTLGGYQPGSSWFAREVRRLEAIADRGFAEGPSSEEGGRARERGRIG